MNLVSSLVGISIAGASMPMMMQISIAPFEAQKRAQNLGVAETAAVTYAALNQGKDSLSDAPDGCDLASPEPEAFTITCTEGDGRYVQSVTRAFLASATLPSTGSGGYSMQAPASYTHYNCPHYDPFGIVAFNKTHLGGGFCIPIPLQSQWHWNNYTGEIPWDISGYGFG